MAGNEQAGCDAEQGAAVQALRALRPRRTMTPMRALGSSAAKLGNRDVAKNSSRAKMIEPVSDPVSEPVESGLEAQSSAKPLNDPVSVSVPETDCGTVAEPLSAAAVPVLSNRAAHWLTSWWHSPAGIRLFAEQAPNIATEVRRFHGDHLLWLGCHNPSAEIVRRCMIRYRFYAAIPGTCPSSDIASFSCDPQALSVRKNSVSAVALHHVLDCVPDPRQLIREVARITEPGGRLLICGFNPWGGWGARALLDQGRAIVGKPGTGVRPIHTGRLLDWLALLGFELTEDVRYVGRSMPDGLRHLQRFPSWQGQRQALGAGSYMITATKRCNAAQQPPALTAAAQPALASSGVFRSHSKAN